MYIWCISSLNSSLDHSRMGGKNLMIHIHHEAYTSICFLNLSASLESALWFFSPQGILNILRPQWIANIYL